MLKNQSKKIFAIFTLSIFLLATFVFAAGTSTTPDSERDTTSNGDADVSENTQEDSSNEEETPEIANTRRIQTENVKERLMRAREKIQTAAVEEKCDTLEDRAERIACRLKRYKMHPGEDKEADYEKRVPEACRSGRNPTACIALYKRVQSNKCYNLEAKEKDRCFKRTIGTSRARLSDLSKEERAEKARNYLILLLYEFQERIEKANKEGNIDDEIAAEIIDLIVEIKQDILDNKKREEILPKLNELKQKIRAVRAGDSTAEEAPQ